MTVTKEQAMSEQSFHYGDCTRTVGPRGGITERVENWRANGSCQTWKRDAKRFRLPVKYGMYAYSAITQDNASEFHAANDCPLIDG